MAELFSTITESTNLKRLERRIRPYRMAIIKLIKPNGQDLSYEYIVNEFGDGLITSVGDGAGVYEVLIDTNKFHNVAQVIQESYINFTEIIDPMLRSSYSNSAKETLNVISYNVTTFTAEDIKGEILLYIKEFYA